MGVPTPQHKSSHIVAWVSMLQRHLAFVDVVTLHFCHAVAPSEPHQGMGVEAQSLGKPIPSLNWELAYKRDLLGFQKGFFFF